MKHHSFPDLCNQYYQSLKNVLILLFALFFFGDIQSQRPNIIYIMTDDMGWGDLSGYGRKDYQTPNLDKLASQGIKFVPEEKPTDQFGKQLKSFTEWLKTMKRLPQSEIPKITDIASEEKVEQMAEHSIDRGDVITETMAEVWIKQGNREKAIETYNKLSLLNPDKSAYFASLAEQLKNG